MRLIKLYRVPISVSFVLLSLFLICGLVASEPIQISLRRKGLTNVSENRTLTAFKEFGFTRREGDGVYYADIRIGTPQQTFSVIVDTGSATIAVPCAGCNCGKHNHFNIAASSTGSVAPGRYRQCYSEGSCNSGENVRDLICIGEHCGLNEAVEHVFGCCTRFARAFKMQEADGIIGMSGSSGTLIADLRKHHMLKDDIFALCLGRNDGGLAVGGFTEERNLEPIQWVPYHPSGAFYALTFTNIYVDGTKLAGFGSAKSPIVDSGTTFTYIPYNLHKALGKAFDNFCRLANDRCAGAKNPSGVPRADRRDAVACYLRPADMDLHQYFATYPSIEFEFSGQKICIPPSSYMYLAKKDIFCIGFLRQSSQRVVIGAITMSEFNVVFDHDKRRIGWARALCDKNDDFGQIDKTACCGSCEIARQNGYRNKLQPKPTMKPTELPILSPIGTLAPYSSSEVSNGFIVQKGPGQKVVKFLIEGKHGEDRNITFKSNEQVIVDFSTTLCEDTIWEFEKKSSLVISGNDTLVTIGKMCSTLPEVLVQKDATLYISSVSNNMRFEGLLVIQGKVIFDSDIQLLGLNLSSTGQLELNRHSSLALLNGEKGNIHLKQGMLLCKGAVIKSAFLLGSGAKMSSASGVTDFLDRVQLKGLLEVALGSRIHAHKRVELEGPVEIASTNAKLKESVAEKAPFISLLSGNPVIGNASKAIYTNKFLSCADSKLIMKHISPKDILYLKLDVICLSMCMEGRAIICNAKSYGGSSPDNLNEPFPAWAIASLSVLAGSFCACMTCGIIFFPSICCRYCTIRIKPRHRYEQIAK